MTSISPRRRLTHAAPAASILGMLLAVLAGAPRSAPAQLPATSQPAGLPAIDPQKVEDQDDMTWDDYHPIPGIQWQDPARIPTTKQFHIALLAADFSDQPFVMTLPKKSDLFTNPQIDPVKREEVPQFYADFWNKPQPVNHTHTINEYWMEQSHGRFGITRVDAFGPYLMPKPLWQYGLNEFGQNSATPDGSRANGRIQADLDALWNADPKRGDERYDIVLRIFAGYDETCIWQEYGEMKFETRDDITPEFGNPDPTKPRWAPTRYEPWTSWKAAEMPWSNSAIQVGESSGSIRHEISHFAFRIGDNNNNPYAEPYRRVASGPWDIMDRGSFNGPGGPHNRWQVPVTQGGAMPAGLMLRQKINFNFLTPGQVLQLSRQGLAKSGLAVATITARAVDPLPGQLAGITIRFDGDPVPLPAGANTGPGRRGGGGGGGGGRARGGGFGGAATGPAAPPAGMTFDRTPWSDPATDPLSPGIPNYNFYSLEVVQRIGYDSYCPDSGVLIAKNKDVESSTGGPNGFNCFNWVINAHPEDINMVDFKRPKSGTPIMRTIADYRQLNDALFHAGLNSGSQYEYEDTPNRLHFYILDVQKDASGILSYTLGVRSLDGAGPQTRGVTLAAPVDLAARQSDTRCDFTLTNTGKSADTDKTLHPQDATVYLTSDIYRLAITVEGQGWSAQLQNALASAKFGDALKVPVFVSHTAASAASATITLKATSESDPTKTATATLRASAVR